MKKRSTLLLGGAFIAGFLGSYGISKLQPTAAAANEVRLYTTPASASAVTGNTVSIQIRLSKTSSAKVDYVKADMKFTTSVLEIVSVNKSGSYFTGSGGPTSTYNNSNGTLVITGKGTSMSTPSDVLISTITFRLKSAGTGTLQFNSGSQAGDLLGSNNVKNSLTASTGSSITGTTPASTTTQPKPSTPSPSPSSTSSPQSPTSTTSTPATDAQTPPAPDQTTTTETTNQEVTQPTPTGQAQNAEDISKSVAPSIQLWQWVAMGVIGVGAITGAGILLMKRRMGIEPPVVAESPESNLEAFAAGLVQPESAYDQFPADTQHEQGNSYAVAPSIQPEVVPETSPVVEPVMTEEPVVVPTPPPVEAFVPPVEPVAAAEIVPAPAPVEPAVMPTAAAVEYSPAPTPAPISVEGIDIQPIDPAMPSPLAAIAEAQTTAPTMSMEPLEQVQPEMAPVEAFQQPAPPAVVYPEPENALPVTEPIPQAQMAATASPEEDFPDMFEEGAARLQAEGLDEQLKPRTT